MTNRQRRPAYQDSNLYQPNGSSMGEGQQHQAAQSAVDRTRSAIMGAPDESYGGGGYGEAMPTGGQNTTMPVGPPVRETDQSNAPSPSGAGPQSPLPQNFGNGVDARNALGGYNSVGSLTGFNTAGYGGDLKAANSMKNTFGRIASRYGNDAAGIQSLLADPDFQRYFPGATYDGIDKINFNGMLSDFESGTPVYDVDIAQAFDKGTGGFQNWAWQDQVNTGGPMAGGGPVHGYLPSNSLYGSVQDSILAPQQENQDPNAVLAQLLQLLGQDPNNLGSPSGIDWNSGPGNDSPLI